MRRGLDGTDAHALLRMSRIVGVGQLGASRRTGSGRRRAPYMLLVHPTAEGCYRQRRVPRAGDETMVEAGPADFSSLSRELDELVALTAVRPGHGHPEADGLDYRRGAGLGSTRPAEAGGIGSWTGAGTR